jgi:hypothetical protein
MLQAGRSPIRVPDEVDFQPHYGLEVDSASDRNEYRNLPGGKKRPARRADNLVATCDLNI